MSYARFKDALDRFYKVDSNKGVHYETASCIIRDQWIDEGLLEQLVKFVVTNWDSGNCEDFIVPIENELERKGNVELFIVLWKGVIKHRLRVLSSSDTQEQRLYVLKGIERFRIGLESFKDSTAQDELIRLNQLEQTIRANKKPKYPK